MLATKLKQWQQGVFFGWWVLVGVMLLQMLVAGVFFQSFGVYVPVLIEEFGWSATAISLAVSARQILGAFTGPGIGFAIDRFGSRRIIAIGLSLMGSGYLLFSGVQSFVFFILIQLLLGFAGNLSGWLPNTKILVNWFTARRTLALALMGVGMSVGGLLSPAIAYFIGLYGWRPVAFTSGLTMFAGLALLPLLRSSPEASGLEPEINRLAAPTTDADFSAREALRTRSFWLIGMGHGVALMSVVSIVVHYVTHLSKGLGFSLQSAASLYALLTAMQMVGQVFSGFLGDKLNKRWLTSTAMLMHAVAIFSLAFAQTFPLIVAASVLHGLAWGMRGPLMSALRADYFGRKAFGKIMGMSDPIIIVGATVGPIVAGYSFDATGSYRLGFIFLSVMALVGSACFAFAAEPVKRS